MSFTPSTRGDFKNSARVASTGGVTLSAPGATIDGITMADGERVLLKDQSSGSENGIYEWQGAASAMRRAPDANQSGELTAGMTITIEEGTANADTTWQLTTNETIIIDTTSLTFEQLGGGTANTTALEHRMWYFGGA